MLFQSKGVEPYTRHKLRALKHFERQHHHRALWRFKRAAQACPTRASEIGQFYYDNGDYKHATFFYNASIKAGGAPPSTYAQRDKATQRWALTAPWHMKTNTAGAPVPPAPQITVRPAP